MEKLSIFIPTRNRAKLLNQLLQQIFFQVKQESYTSTDLKIYISDNFSDDDTYQISHKFIKLYPSFIEYRKNNCNLGPIENISIAKDFLHGEYCWIHSDDELMEANAIKSVLSILNKERIGLLIAGCKTYPFNMSAYKYDNYSYFLKACAIQNQNLPLAHTHLTANIFLLEIFDKEIYKTKWNSSYAQMYAIISGLKSYSLPIVLSNDPIMIVRRNRARPDPDTVSKKLFFDYDNLLDRQFEYLNWLKDSFNIFEMNIKSAIVGPRIPKKSIFHYTRIFTPFFKVIKKFKNIFNLFFIIFCLNEFV